MDNKFINNSAKEGGAIKWLGNKPILKNNSFLSNSADYGANIASEPCKIVMIVYEMTQNENNETVNVLFNSLKTNDRIILNNITSGINIPYIIEFQILDIYNEIVSMDLT